MDGRLMGIQMEGFKLTMETGRSVISTGELLAAALTIAESATELPANHALVDGLAGLGIGAAAVKDALAGSEIAEPTPEHDKGPAFKPLTHPALDAMNEVRAVEEAGKEDLILALTRQRGTVAIDVLTKLGVGPADVALIMETLVARRA